jgi:hypothetical protein
MWGPLAAQVCRAPAGSRVQLLQQAELLPSQLQLRLQLVVLSWGPSPVLGLSSRLVGMIPVTAAGAKHQQAATTATAGAAGGQTSGGRGEVRSAVLCAGVLGGWTVKGVCLVQTALVGTGLCSLSRFRQGVQRGQGSLFL